MKSVILKRYLTIEEEKVAVAAITPGHLVELTSADKVQVHGTAEGNAQRMFAREDGIVGKTITDAYSADDRVPVVTLTPGDEVNAILAVSMTIVVGDFLASNGDGTLRKHVPVTGGFVAETDITVVPEPIVGVAIEAVTTTATVSRIAVKVI